MYVANSNYQATFQKHYKKGEIKEVILKWKSATG